MLYPLRELEMELGTPVRVGPVGVAASHGGWLVLCSRWSHLVHFCMSSMVRLFAK